MNPELQKILDTIADRSTREKAKAFFDELMKGTNDFDTALERVNTRFGRGLDVVQELRGVIQANLEELGSTNQTLNIQRKAYRDVGKAVDNILYRTKGIESATIKQLEKDKLLVERAKARSDVQEEQNTIFDQTIERIDEEIKHQEKINQTIGLTGAAFDNLNRIGQRAFGGLGINLGALEESFKDVSEAIRAKGEEIARAAEEGEQLGTISNRFKTFGAALKPLGKGLKDVFTDPLIILNGITEALFAIDKASTSLANTTGQSFKDIQGLALGTSNAFATAVDLAEVIVAETEQSGLNANNIFSPEILAGAAEFKNMVGGTADEIAGLLSLTSATNMSTQAIQESIVDTTSAFNGANRAAISQRTVLKDVLAASTAVQASLAGNPKALAEAASAARRLGLSLQEVDSIADSLLDFESSINSELEAQLLTGRSLNLSKARELALTNDLAGLGEEIFKNQVSVAEFSQMNRIQQDGFAKALGISRDQLAKMAFQQAKLNGLTDEAAAAAAGVELSDLQRAEAIEALQKSLTSFLQILAPVLDRVASFVSMIAEAPGLVKYILLLSVAFKPIVSSVKSIGSFFKDSLETAKELKNAVVGLFSRGSIIPEDILPAGSTVIESAPIEQAGDAAEQAKEKIESFTDVSEKAGEAAPSAGEGIKSFFENIGKGLKSFGQSLKAGGLGYIAAGIGLLTGAMIGLGFALKLAAPGIKAFGTVITSVFQGIGHLITTTAEAIQNLMSTLTLGQIGTLAAAAASFFALGSALAFLGTAGLIGLPVLVSLTPILLGVGAAAGLGASIGAGTAEGENTMAKVEEKLDKLIAVVEKGGNVYLDGNLVGIATVLGTFKSR